MIHCDREPASMTEAERCREIADILANGFLRLQISRISTQNSLAGHGQSEASCDSEAMSPKSDEDEV